MPISKVCEHCKKQFSVPPRRSHEVRFCSRDCKTAAGYVELKCAGCGAIFRRKASDNARSTTAYCSKSCYNGKQPGRTVKPDAPRHYKVCETCRKDFRVTLTRKDTARWCSRSCQSASPAWRLENSQRQQGENHWRWSGGQTLTADGYLRVKRKELEDERSIRAHRQIILDAMARECPDHPFLKKVRGEPGKRRLRDEIDVHHIDRVKTNNELSNLLAVTRRAHSLIHRKNRRPADGECWPPNPSRW